MTAFLCPHVASCHPAGSRKGFMIEFKAGKLVFGGFFVCLFFNHFLGLCCTLPMEN